MIPVFSPDIRPEDVDEVVRALARGEISGTFGKAIPRFEARLAAQVGVKHAVVVSSGTAALQLAVQAAGVGAGDEVLVSASTNIATALAAVHNGALPVPVDSEPRTGNIDVALVDALCTPRTRAIIPVHLFGHPVDMDALLPVARKRGLVVIEDCAESHGATVRGRMTGSFGDMGCFSFYANKIVTTGEGGAVVTDDDALAERLRLLRNLGFAQPRFVHAVLGHNFRMTGMQAALGTRQLGRLDEIVAAKRRMADRYRAALAAVPHLVLPVEESWARHVYWMFALMVREGCPASRDEVMERLRSDGVETRTFFCPMSAQPCLQALPGFRSAPCPVADAMWERGFYLPSSPTLTDQQIAVVATALSRAVA